ncbi:uncharacterized protein LOC101459870 [Ceratitis capitata]|uniref:(Mediterranean fruit fly) hypothetical protein n=1 Tax=Ceratitis capitata TaxID=7213 RepID=A0A811V854_CERCA|nr:uncharacterized protein LOC101459870 [Ceratitis capitata]CAD7005997.1 unnamed protein product [Ceratitis capitata]
MATRKLSVATLLLGCLVCAVHSAALAPVVVNITDVSEPAPIRETTSTTVTPLSTTETVTSTSTETQKSTAALPVIVDEPTAHAEQQAEEGRSVAPIVAKELDGRSAYINNQYVADEEPLSYNDTSPPLYQFLQERMEQILASSLPGEYHLETNAGNKESTATSGAVGKEMTNNGYGMPALQNSINSPVFAYGGTNFEEDDDLVGSYGKIQDEKFYHGTAPTKPSTLELPKPIKMHTVVVRPKLPATTTTTSTTESPKTSNTGGYGLQLSLPAVSTSQQYKPQVTTNGGYGTHNANYKPPVKEEFYTPPTPNKYTYVRQNSTVHMRKRRITFKTVASASQIISTPMADLMFKYSIGVAKPSMAAGGNSLYEQDDQPIRNIISNGYNGNLDMPKQSYGGKISHSSHRKN